MFSRQHKQTTFSDAGFLGSLRVKHCLYNCLELSIAQTSGLEFLLMGDFNIDLKAHTNNKWLNLINLFDLTQLVTEPTRVTETTDTLIDHVYTAHPENIVRCFTSTLSLSDHFPICFTRKVNSKLLKDKHTATTYRNYKHFD